MEQPTAAHYRVLTSSSAARRIQELEQALQQAQAQRAAAETRLEHLVNHLQEGLLLTDACGTIVLLNERFRSIWDLGKPADQWVGRNWEELGSSVLPVVADSAAFLERVRELREQAQPVYRELVPLRDGRVLERDFVLVQEVGEAAPHTLVRLRDATEHHRTTEQLRSVASIPAQNPNPILRVNPAGQLLYTNAAAQALYHVLTPVEQSRLLAKAQSLAISAMQQNQPWEVDLSIGAGFFTAFVTPCVEDEYANLYLIDITKRLLVEQALHQAKDQAEAAARARENFLANMSHEIRTPMNGVLGMAAQLAKTPLSAQQQQFVGVIRSSGQHLLSVINDVLDMAKITSGKLELEQRPFNICDSMAEALQPLMLQAAEKGITMTGTRLRESCPLPWVSGDQYRLNQVLINLVANAVKFTEPGGHIHVAGQQLGSTEDTLTVEFAVTDTGLGIPPELQERIFEGFTQAYADTTRRFGGTGLGLSISRAIVEQLGGSLTVESEAGRGSTFRFVLTLPRMAPVPPPAPAATLDTGALRGRHVLLVEDNEINRDVARLLLEEWGVEVDEAENGPVGLEMFRHRTYDAILMDIQMPGMSGLEATAIIRKLPDPTRANVPIMALTANALRADNMRYLAAGMNACLTKPFEEADLYHQLEALLQPRPGAPAVAPSYCLSKLRALAHGRDAFVLKIVQSFLQHTPASLEQLQEAAATNDWGRVAGLVHHIKPGLESLGVQEVAETVRQLEQDAPVSEADQIARRGAVSHLVVQLQRVLRELPQELSAPGAPRS